MSLRSEKERTKAIQDKCQNMLTQMLRDEDNKYCVDCDAKGPRWASWNLGIFLCIRCAGIHRNLGVHISKVKSVNLDSWTPEQVVSIQQMGNSRARAVYEANLPDSFRRPQTDCTLESFIRSKYEHKKYIAREWVPPPLPKVNWDKELDEEAERQRRRKREGQRNSTNQNTLPPVKKPEVVPQLPKPHIPFSLKPNKSSGTVTNLDLLELDVSENQTSNNSSTSGDDIFSSFLSAPPASSAPVTNGSSTETNGTNSTASISEEESFFNQPAPTPQEKSKMTKDSILALYGTQPSQPIGSNIFNQQISSQPFQQSMPNVGPFNQSMNQSLQSQMNMPSIGQMNIMPNQLGMNPNQLSGVSNPMTNNAAMAMQAQMQQGVSNSGSQMVLGSNNGWSGMIAGPALQPTPGNNPFLNLGAQPQMTQPFGQLPQQMAQMSLNGVNFSTPTTLWQ